MAYTKTTWNNLSDPPINAENLNKIEQGIYNNSLGIDIINPSGTATTSTEIEEGQITDVIGFKSLKLKGQTSQYTTTGKNLCNEEFVQGTFNGTTTTRISCRNIELKANTTYTLSSNLNYSNFNISAVTSTNTFPIQASETPSYDSGWKSATFSFTTGADNVYCNIAVRKSDNSNITPNEVDGIHFQLEQGSSATSYEKYTGGKASPNPDFPQDVNNVSGDNVIGISNKNLIENETFVQGSAGDNTGTKRISCRNIKLKANTTYTFSSNLNYSTYNVTIGTSKDKFPTTSFIYDSGWKTSNFSFTTGDDDVYANIAIKKVGELVIVPSDVSTYHFQIEQNNSATSYIAHQGNDFEINLSTNVVYSPRIWQNTSTVATQANRLFSTPQKLVKAGTYKLATTLDFTTYKYALEVGTTPYPFVSNLYDSGWKTTNNFSHTIPKGFVGIIVTRLDNANITADEMKGVKFELRDTTLDDYDIELCKIGTYQDYIYKKDGKWWKHKFIEKIILNGTETWSGASTGTGSADYTYFYSNVLDNKVKLGQYVGFCNNMKVLNGAMLVSTVVSTDTMSIANYGGQALRLLILTSRLSEQTVNAFKTWLSTNKPELYYVLATPEDEEITYTPLIRQLDELYNSGLYDVTNLSQDNSSEAFILDLEACKNNINGIVEYIRR